MIVNQKQIIAYFELNLCASFTKEQDGWHEMKGDFKETRFTFCIAFSGHKISNYCLFIHNGKFLDGHNHLNSDGTACLGITKSNKNDHEEIVLSVMDWLQNYHDVTYEEKKHDHGYRHNNDGIIEKYIQRNFLPFHWTSIEKLTHTEYSSLVDEISENGIAEFIEKEKKNDK